MRASGARAGKPNFDFRRRFYARACANASKKFTKNCKLFLYTPLKCPLKILFPSDCIFSKNASKKFLSVHFFSHQNAKKSRTRSAPHHSHHSPTRTDRRTKKKKRTKRKSSRPFKTVQGGAHAHALTSTRTRPRRAEQGGARRNAAQDDQADKSNKTAHRKSKQCRVRPQSKARTS